MNDTDKDQISPKPFGASRTRAERCAHDRAQEWMGNYTGTQDEKTMRFSESEMRIAHMAGQALFDPDLPGRTKGGGFIIDPSGTAQRAPEAERPTCVSCAHWEAQMDKDFNTDTGQCRMNAPVLTGGLHGPERTLWPLTDETDWCGQHSALSMVISGEFQSVREAHDALQERFAAEGEAFGYVEGTKVPDWMGGDALPQSEPHWHIVQNVAQRLGAHRSREKSGRWNVPAFGRIGITAAELVDLDRATGSATLHQRPSPEMDPPRAPEPDLVFHRSPRVQAAARKLGATPAGWPVAEGKEAATLWRLPGQLASIGTAELLRLADNAK